MMPRRFDERVGFFSVRQVDFGIGQRAEEGVGVGEVVRRRAVAHPRAPRRAAQREPGQPGLDQFRFRGGEQGRTEVAVVVAAQHGPVRTVSAGCGGLGRPVVARGRADLSWNACHADPFPDAEDGETPDSI